jgi:large subunit ribosomal protein L7/L12
VSLTRAEAIAYLEGLSSAELGGFIDALQRRLGVRVPAPPRELVTMGAPLVDPDEPTRFTVVLRAVGPRKVRVMQVLREHLRLVLSEALAACEDLPRALAAVDSRRDADELLAALREVGAEAELRA